MRWRLFLTTPVRCRSAREQKTLAGNVFSLSLSLASSHTHPHSISRPVTVQFDTLQWERLYCHCDHQPKNEKSDFCNLGIKKFYKKFVNQKVLPISQIVSVKLSKLFWIESNLQEISSDGELTCYECFESQSKLFQGWECWWNYNLSNIQAIKVR